MRTLPRIDILSLLYPIPIIIFIIYVSSSALAAGNGSSVLSETQAQVGDGTPTLQFFLLVAGSLGAVLIPLLIFILLLVSWAACDLESMRILRNLNSLKKLRRVVVSQDVWDQLLADPALRKDMADAGVKIRVKDVTGDTPLIKSLIKLVRMKAFGAQAIELARAENLRYVWIDGNRLSVKRLLNKMTP